MSIEAGLVQHLRADPAVAALVGDRVYPASRIPEGTALPALTYQRISTIAQHTLYGIAGLTSVRIQVTAWAARDAWYSECRRIAAAVIRSLVGFRGDWHGGVPISGINLGGMQDVVQDPDSEVGGVDMDFVIWHRGAVP